MKRQLILVLVTALFSLCLNTAHARDSIKDKGDRAVAGAKNTRFDGHYGSEGFGDLYVRTDSISGRPMRHYRYVSDGDESSGDSTASSPPSPGANGSSDTGADEGQKKRGFFGRLSHKIFGEGTTGTTWGWCLALGLGFGILAAIPWFAWNPPVAAMCIVGGLLGGALVAVAITRL
jgi:hypothetical protein